LTTDRWIEAVIDHVPPQVNVAVYLRGRGGDQLLTFETAADIDAAKAIAHAHAKKRGIADEHISFQERNRDRRK
jgi:glycosylphosphatidylinositol transamidase (GPIT) subunit GPI8